MNHDEQTHDQQAPRAGQPPRPGLTAELVRPDPELEIYQIELESQNEELRRMNTALEQANRRYTELFEGAPVGYMTVDELGLIGSVNQAGCRQLGAAPQQLIGRRLTLFVEARQRVAFTGQLQALFAAQAASCRMELQLNRHDGGSFEVQLECSLLPDRERPLARVILTDISALKTAQREVERLNEVLGDQVEQRSVQIRQLQEELALYVASLTYGMDRPIRQLHSFVGLLSHSLKQPDDKSAHYLQRLSDIASQTLERFSVLSRFFHDDRPSVARRRLELNRLVDGLFRELEFSAGPRDVHFTRDELPVLDVHVEEVRLIFSHLLENAVKFTGSRPQANIHVGVHDLGESYLFCVQDNGVGFDASRSERLFGLFQKLHSEQLFIGQGLGLAQVRRAVQHLQGRIWAESAPDQGAVFRVELPKAPLPLQVN